MGIYKTEQEEIIDKIWNVLDNIEGDITCEDFQRACNKVADKYPNFT